MHGRQAVLECAVDPFGVIENKIVHEFSVKRVRVFEQEGIVINKLFLDRPVEPFEMRIHLRGLRISVKMGEVKSTKLLGKVFLEFRAVVSQDIKEIVRMRKCSLAKREELCRSQGSMALRTPRKRESRIDILKSDHIPPATIYKPLHRIKRHEITRIAWREILWFSQHFLAVGNLYLAEVGDFLRKCPQSAEIVNEIADSAGSRA